MEKLLQPQYKWQHLINLCGQDFPMNTNARIESYAHNLNHESDIQSVQYQLSDRKYRRVTQRQIAISEEPNRFGYIEKHALNSEWYVSKESTYLEQCPFERVYFGLAYNTYSRNFLSWSFEDEKAKAFLKWAKFTFSPDEHYWATLIRYS